MALSCCIDLSDPERGELLGIARQSINSGLCGPSALQLAIENLPANFSTPLGAFVTLTRSRELRGCIGHLETSDPLAQTVANTAFNAAFRDSRFPPLGAEEIDDIRIEISVLSELKPLAAANRVDLLNLLRPGTDGLVLQDNRYRATFLPKVWDQISSPEEFLQQLLAKAGLPESYWSETICFKRYQALSFGEQVLDQE